MKKTMDQVGSGEECNFKGDGKEEFKKLSEEERKEELFIHILNEMQMKEGIEMAISLIQDPLEEI